MNRQARNRRNPSITNKTTMEGKYYENGDCTILVLKILEQQTGSRLFICLRYSPNHKMYNIKFLTQQEFELWYANNELTGGYEFDDLSFKGLL